MSAFSEEAMGESGSGVGGENGFSFLSDNFAVVDFGSEFEEGDAGGLVT